MKFLELLFPIRAEIAVRDVIAAPEPDRAGDFFLRLIRRQVTEIPFVGRVVGLLALQHQALRAGGLHFEAGGTPFSAPARTAVPRQQGEQQQAG